MIPLGLDGDGANGNPRFYTSEVIDPRPLPGKHLYADVDQIAELRERGVVLAVTRDELRDPPDEQNRRKRAEGADTPETPLAGLQRAWDRLTRRRAG